MRKNLRRAEFEITEQPHPLEDLPEGGERTIWQAAREQVERLERQLLGAEASLRKAAELSEAARRRLLLDLIEGVMDNLDRSLAGVEGDRGDAEARRWIRRLQRTRRTLEQLLAQEQVVPIDFAQAPDGLVSTREVIERSDVPEGTILEIDYRGYLWRGELLRKASVVRAVPPGSSSTPPT
ncbi:MAG: nucleotide exchange factor GrpE [Chloroflexi bacterium]|nr:nucleotide exchange factor GrpE [Chloroflexota bacterium]